MTTLTLCDHHWMHLEYVLAEIDEADPIRHTSFMLIGCQRCRTVDAFPPMNAKLATPRFVERLRRELATRGWRLPPDIEWGP